MKQRPSHPDLSLKELIDIKEWRKIQDNFSTITEVYLRTVDPEGNPIILSSKGRTRLCNELLKEPYLKNKICGNCLPTFLGGRAVVDRNLSFACRVGLNNFIAPLRIENNVLGYIIVGPVILVMRKNKEEYRKVAEELNLDLDDFWSALLEIKVISFQGAQSLVELIKGVGEYTIKLAYQNVIRKEEVMMVFDSTKINRLLNVLLEVAFQVTGADIGSIMFFDKESNELTIRAARGIPEDIVKDTRVRLGEGISGIAIQERRPFLIDENLKDRRIESYLSRPHISSSMVLPINVKDRAVGVMNLGALKTSTVRFNLDNVHLMNKLIDLATVALQ